MSSQSISAQQSIYRCAKYICICSEKCAEIYSITFFQESSDSTNGKCKASFGRFGWFLDFLWGKEWPKKRNENKLKFTIQVFEPGIDYENWKEDGECVPGVLSLPRAFGASFVAFFSFVGSFTAFLSFFPRFASILIDKIKTYLIRTEPMSRVNTMYKNEKWNANSTMTWNENECLSRVRFEWTDKAKWCDDNETRRCKWTDDSLSQGETHCESQCVVTLSNCVQCVLKLEQSTKSAFTLIIFAEFVYKHWFRVTWAKTKQ